MDEVKKAINRFSALLEEQNSKLDAVLEAVGDIQRKVAALPRTEQRLDTLEQHMGVVEAAMTDLSHQVADHKRQLMRLKTA